MLGVARDSGDAAITAAYHRLARRHHPDVAGDHATRRMMAINAAFDLIRTAERRAEYDIDLAADGIDLAPRRPRRSPPTSTSEPGATRAGAASRHGFADPDVSRSSSPSGDRWTSERDGTGGAGPAPGRPSGSVLTFGRHIGWSIGEIARVDPGYLAWLAERREGRSYLAEIEQTLRRVGYRG